MNRLVLLLVASLLSAGLQITNAQDTAQAEKLLASAQRKASVDGDLKGAIEDYKKAIASAGGNRALAAQALLRMAECHQKLGDNAAQTIYERVVREYADQTEAVASARTRLGTTGAAAKAAGDRVVKVGEHITWGDGRVSPDGRFVCYTDWSFTGNLMLHNLVTGVDRALTSNKDWTIGNAYSSSFSPDGKQIAYGWRTYGRPVDGQPETPHANELRVMTLDGSGFPQPRRVYSNPEINVFNPTDWSPDGRWLAVKVTRRDLTGQIALVGVHDGAFRALKTVGWRGPNKMFFSPDGKYLAYDLPPNDDDVQRDVLIIAIDGSNETPAVEHPSDDVVMGWSPDSNRLLFASDRTGVVALWAQPVVSGKPHGAPTMLKPDIGSIYSQGLTASGTLHVVKDASTVSLQVVPIDLASGKLAGPPVLENFRSGRPDWTPDGRLIAYKTVSSNNVQTLAIRASGNSQVRRLPIALQYMAEPRWMPDGLSVVANGRDLKGRGGIFRIDAQTGRVTLVTGMDGNSGRVQISPDGKKIYYAVGGGALRSAIPAVVERDVTTGEVREVFRRPSTMGAAELSPDGRFFAVVNGEYAKTSTVLIFPVTGGPARELFRVNLPDELQAYGGLTWTPDSKAVVVANTIAEGRQLKELWLVPLTTGNARKLDVDIRNWLGQGVRLHPNGRQIAFFTGQDLREVWAIATAAPAAARPSAKK